MYSSDLVEAFAHEQQRTILDRAAAGRRARAARTAGAGTPGVRTATVRTTAVRTPAVREDATGAVAVAPAPRRHRPHPVAAVHSWLAAGQLRALARGPGVASRVAAGNAGGVCSEPAGTLTAAACVAEAMVRAPKLCDRGTTVGALRRLFVDDHVHAALIVDGPELLAVVERADLDARLPDGLPAARVGTLDGRVVAAAAPLDAIHQGMARSGRRRLAVIDASGALLGLLCLKRTGLGFCSDADVQAREAERAGGRAVPNTGWQAASTGA